MLLQRFNKPTLRTLKSDRKYSDLNLSGDDFDGNLKEMHAQVVVNNQKIQRDKRCALAYLY